MSIKAKKIAVCLLAACALVTAGFAMTSMGQASQEEDTIGCLSENEDSRYVLRDYEGYVAVFVENDPSCPMTVTDIQVSTLRELDQIILQTGMKVNSHERLIMTLEDLGS